MNIGTKSLLFGVHQFLWHPFTVGLAWKKLYGVWPKWNEWIAIFCHDLGYKGCPNMDGPEGTKHPEAGAALVHRLVFNIGSAFAYDARTRLDALILANKTLELAIFHSTHYAQRSNTQVSKLYLPDKMSILYEPKWFYILRAKLTGEIDEYRRNAPVQMSPSKWFDWYKQKIQDKYDAHCFTTRALELRAHSNGARGNVQCPRCLRGADLAGRTLANRPRTLPTYRRP